MKNHPNPKAWKVRVILVVLGAAIASMSFFGIGRDRWSIVGYNPPPGAKGIEPTLWLAFVGLFLVLVGVFPWEPFKARRRKAAKPKGNLQPSRRPPNRSRRPAPRRNLLA